MTILWIGIAIAVVGVLARRLVRTGRDADLDFVSRQWLTDYRLSQLSNPGGDR